MEEEKKLAETTEVKVEQKSKSDDKKTRKRRSIKSILGDYKGEYKKIIWPTKKDLAKETLVVVVTCIIVGAIITALDISFSNLYNLFITHVGNLIS